MATETAQTLVAIIALAVASIFFFMLARRTGQADPSMYKKAQRLTRNRKDAVLGSVGWREANMSMSDVDCGMVSREQNGQLTIIRQARLTHDTVASL